MGGSVERRVASVFVGRRGCSQFSSCSQVRQEPRQEHLPKDHEAVQWGPEHWLTLRSGPERYAEILPFLTTLHCPPLAVHDTFASPSPSHNTLIKMSSLERTFDVYIYTLAWCRCLHRRLVELVQRLCALLSKQAEVALPRCVFWQLDVCPQELRAQNDIAQHYPHR